MPHDGWVGQPDEVPQSPYPAVAKHSSPAEDDSEQIIRAVQDSELGVTSIDSHVEEENDTERGQAMRAC